jgi:probable rRNA maturation factor
MMREGPLTDSPVSFLRGPSNSTQAAEKALVILKKRVPGLRDETLARFALRARRAAGLPGLVDILLTSSDELRQLNRRFRKKDKPTDVLSFPLGEANTSFAGDLAISVDIAARNARLLGHSAADEIKILILHGVLHLAGHDHESDRGEMAREEARLRKLLGLPVGLIERSQGASNGHNAQTRRPGRQAP